MSSRLRAFLAGVATGVLATAAAASYLLAKAERDTAPAEARVELLEEARVAAVARADSERVAREASDRQLAAERERWARERAELRAVGRQAAAEASELREGIRAIAPPDIDSLVSAYAAERDAELAAERGLRLSAEEEAATGWDAAGAERRLRIQVDEALAAALREIEARELLEEALRRQLRPTFWSRIPGEVAWTAAAVGAGVVCSEAFRDRGDVALLACGSGAALTIAIAR